MRRFGRGDKGKGKGKGNDGKKGGGYRKEEFGKRSDDWESKEDRERRFERKRPREESDALEHKFDVHILREGQTRTGYLFNFKPTTVSVEEFNTVFSALNCYFLCRDGSMFRATYIYRPYFLVDFEQTFDANEMAKALGRQFAQGVATVVERTDLDMDDHLIGKMHKFVQLSFDTADELMRARRELQDLIKEVTGEDVTMNVFEYLRGLYEHDVIYSVRASIDNEIRCGKWYEVARAAKPKCGESDTTLTALDDYLVKPDLRVFAWDIECTKAPLQFPDAQIDRITMISIMFDGAGFLLVNRDEVSQDIQQLDYNPKPEYSGSFKPINCLDEKTMLVEFFGLIHKLSPHILVTFNGDFFDFPFVSQRAEIHGLEMEKLTGLKKVEGDVYSGKWMLHLDCFAWVCRDSYLPQGSHGLKAVTRAKLKYEPVELDPEVMTPYAQDHPQDLAAYSVSDAVATYYLYRKYIHDFIFALCSIIPFGGDDVLRKGSGTLCEQLLMAEAFRKSIVFPNKFHEEPIRYHNGRLVETATYEGGRVECLRTGVFRAEFPEKFTLDPTAFKVLEEELRGTVDFFLEKEANVKREDIANYDEVVADVRTHLENLRLNPIRTEGPRIYHVDVAAMYPNIILSNRLQPSAIVDKETCGRCSFNKEREVCGRKMDWKVRWDLFMVTQTDMKQLEAQLSLPSNFYTVVNEFDGEVSKVQWPELDKKQRTAELIKGARLRSVRMYRRLKNSTHEMQKDIVCQRENSFYVDTVRDFRDRRYIYKGLVKSWKGKLEKATDPFAKAEATDMVLLYDSLQLAHKCILNSFYGYVMRKGARWHSMKMAGIVTYTGSSLIKEARAFVDRVGLPLELDTDGIWCMLPKSFPENFFFQTTGGKKLKMEYPCSVMNYRVHQKYTNTQYHDLKEDGSYHKHDENSIFFELDGPYKAMVLPASTDEDRMLKKRYAVFEFDGTIAELKGFEIKRRGELKLIQRFQEQVFPAFLKGDSREEVYAEVGAVANRYLDILETRGAFLTDEEVVDLISERKSMSKSVEESGNYKSTAITCARRLAEFLGSSLLKDKGISCHLVIAAKPATRPTTERAIPLSIFEAPEAVKKSFIRKWLDDPSHHDFDIRGIVDWTYYKQRLDTCINKIITIPALNQRITNPCPRVNVPEWLQAKVRMWNDPKKQQKLQGYFKPKNEQPEVAMEDLHILEKDEKGLETPEKCTKPASVRRRIAIEEPQVTVRIEQDPQAWAATMKQTWHAQARKGTQRTETQQHQTWQILSVEPDPRIPGKLRLWVLGSDIFPVTVRGWQRKIYADVDVSSVPHGRAVQKQLPRGQPVQGQLREMEVDDFDASKVSAADGILGVYEGEVPPAFDFVVRCGVVIKEPSRPQVRALSRQEVLQLRADALPYLTPSPLLDEPGFLWLVESGDRMCAVVHTGGDAERAECCAFFCGLQELGHELRRHLVKIRISREDRTSTEHCVSKADLYSKLDKVLADKAARVRGVLVVSSTMEASLLTAQVASMSKFPVCVAPAKRADFPALNWPGWCMKQFASRRKEEAGGELKGQFCTLGDWWVERMTLCREACVPICTRGDVVHYALDVLYGRVLREDQCLLWASGHPRPDLGSSLRSKADMLEADSMDSALQPRNSPGIYRSFVLEIKVGRSLCVAALLTGDAEGIGGHSSSASRNAVRALMAVAKGLFERGNRLGAKADKLGDSPDADAMKDRVQRVGHMLQSIDGWLSSPGSLLHDPALIRAVHSLMQATLESLAEELQKNGCHVVYADATRVVVATGKTCLDKAVDFWTAVKENLQLTEAFTCIPFNDDALTSEWYGVTWMDAANFAYIPVTDDFEDLTKWTVEFELQHSETLPAAVRTTFVNYVADWLMKPMKKLIALEEPEKLARWMLDEYLNPFRKKLYGHIDKFLASEGSDGAKVTNLEKLLEEHQHVSLLEGEDREADEKEVERLRRKWALPDVCGVVEVPECPAALAFVKLYIQFLRQEKDARIQEEVRKLRRQLLLLLREREFDARNEFCSFHHPVCVTVMCGRCRTVERIDVTTHLHRGPGLWECRECKTLYNQRYVEALLVEFAEATYIKWQSQDLACLKCGQIQHGAMRAFCVCAGSYGATLQPGEVRRELLALQSVAVPHALPELEEIVGTFLRLL